MTTALLRLRALLLAVTESILTLSGLVASLLTSVRTAFECLATDKSTEYI